MTTLRLIIGRKRIRASLEDITDLRQTLARYLGIEHRRITTAYSRKKDLRYARSIDMKTLTASIKSAGT